MLSGYFHFGNNHIFVQFALFKDISVSLLLSVPIL